MIKGFQVLAVNPAHELLNQARIFVLVDGGGNCPNKKNVDCINRNLH